MDAEYTKLTIELNKIQQVKRKTNEAQWQRINADVSLVSSTPAAMPSVAILPQAVVVQADAKKRARDKKYRDNRKEKLRKIKEMEEKIKQELAKCSGSSGSGSE